MTDLFRPNTRSRLKPDIHWAPSPKSGFTGWGRFLSNGRQGRGTAVVTRPICHVGSRLELQTTRYAVPTVRCRMSLSPSAPFGRHAWNRPNIKEE